MEADLALTQKIVTIIPEFGSIGGTTIVATVPGVGTASTGMTLTDSAGVDICETVTVPSYGVLHCTTFKAEIVSTLKLQASDGTAVVCLGNCVYEQMAAFANPAVASVSSTETTIVYTGTDFFTSGYVTTASYNGMAADSVVVDSAT